MTARPDRAARTVTIPRSEYEALRAALDCFEDAAAVAAYRATRADESLPIEVADRLLAGENPLRVWRRHRGMTQRALAAVIGKSYLSEIESGKKDGSIRVIKAAAKALGVDLDDLV
jgi:DNA-binding XRE family transcriptional regulator